MTFVIPRFLSLFAMFGHDLPLPTRILIATSTFMGTWWPVLAVGLAVLVLGLRRCCAAGAAALAPDESRGCPSCAAVSHKAEMAVFGQTLAALTRSGV